MIRYAIDCREIPSKVNCSLKMTADSREEIVEAAAQHTVSAHGHRPTNRLRKELESLIVEEGVPLRDARHLKSFTRG